ncbi:hypothetical protein Tco_1222840, partial [Tanacetum coccineum]
RKAHSLEEKQIPSVGVFDEVSGLSQAMHGYATYLIATSAATSADMSRWRLMIGGRYEVVGPIANQRTTRGNNDEGLRLADSHTGNHPEDDFTPLETIRRSNSTIGKKIPFELEGEAFELEGRFAHDYDIPRNVRVILPKISQTIYDAPLGFVGLYTHHFSLSNLRLPIPLFICDVLNYFKVYISRFNPFGMIKLTTFAVMCKAYGGEPSVDLLRSFLNLCRAGDWLTLSNRGGTDVPKALMKPVQRPRGNKSQKACDLSSWTGYTFVCLFNFIPKGGLDKNQGSLSAKSVNNETPMIDAEPISNVHPSKVAENIIDSYNTSPEEDELSPIGPSASLYPEAGEKSKAARKKKLTVDAPREGFHKRAWNVPAQASKVAGDSSTPLDVDSDPDIRGKPEPLYGDATDYRWVVAHVTPPSWKPYLRDISIEQLYDIHDRAYIRQAVLDIMLNSKTRELDSALHKARASCDAILEREIQKDKAYA